MRKQKYIQYRRRREGLTDYRKRLKLLLSRKPRFVVRKSLRHIRVQLVDYAKNGDKILASAFSKELKKFNWNNCKSNIPTAYLTGMLCAARAKGICDEAIFDIGLSTPTKGLKLYAAMKGAVDAGMRIPHNPETLPSEERIKGAHITAYSKNVHASKLAQEFEDVKKKILESIVEKTAKNKVKK